MEEASQGDSVSGGELGDDGFPLQEVLLFLLECGVSEASLFGWHEGWCFEKVSEAFVHFKGREVEKQRDRALAVALGASSLVSKKPLEKFLKESDSATKKSSERPVQSNLQEELGKLMSAFNG